MGVMPKTVKFAHNSSREEQRGKSPPLRNASDDEGGLGKVFELVMVVSDIQFRRPRFSGVLLASLRT